MARMRISRRSFLRTSLKTSLKTSLAASLAGGSLLPRLARAQSGSPKDLLRVALVGCGGRGSGAASQALATRGEVQLVAVADAFSDRLDSCLEHLAAIHGERVAVPEERKFVGFDAYRQAIDADVDVVILATPPGFRPLHFEYAVNAGRHVFMEKPVAVDGPGIRRVLAAAEVARSRDLKIGVGLQRHHDARYLETIERIRQGAIGEIVLLRAYWDSGGVWTRPREAGQTEMEYQMRNWYYFNWLCGDHIVEQHIHNLDVCNWVMGATPVSAQGQGGRQVRSGIEHGEIFDHLAVEFTYANGTKLMSQCRHIPGTWTSVSEHASGSEGTANISAGRIEGRGGWNWRWRGDVPDAYQVEHDVLFAAIREGHEHNEARRGAEATMTAILGRMATYSGQQVSWNDALGSELSLSPESYAWDAAPPTSPDAEGRYPIPMPGVTRAF